MKTKLRGLTWDHPRGFDPLANNTAAFHALRPDVEVVWDRRSLQHFGDQPLEALAERYDLLMIDHPFSGRAATSGCLKDLRTLCPGLVTACLADTAGPSAAAYHWKGAVYALPTDAACHVAAWREDLLAAASCVPPTRFDEVLALAGDLGRRGLSIAAPCGPTDAMCSLTTLLANLGAPFQGRIDETLDLAVLGHALDALAALIKVSHPASTSWNPIDAYEAMATGETIAYMPFAFGYSNYGLERPGRHRLRFGPVPGPGAPPYRGAILGGAGCAVSARAKDLDAIVDYLVFVHAPGHQAGAYFDAGGQPGSRAAWQSRRLNDRANGFFADTLPGLELAYVRPRFSGFVAYFEAAGARVTGFLRGEHSRAETLEHLHQGYRRALDAAPSEQVS